MWKFQDEDLCLKIYYILLNINYICIKQILYMYLVFSSKYASVKTYNFMNIN